MDGQAAQARIAAPHGGPAHPRDVIQRAEIIRDYLLCQPSPIAPSRFWRDLGQENLRQLSAHGVLNFKRTVNQNYFNWPVEGSDDPQMRQLIRAWADSPSLLPFQAELRGSAELNAAVETKHIQSRSTARAYTIFVGMLWWYAARADQEGLASRLSEPALGNPVDIRLEGRRIPRTSRIRCGIGNG